MRMKANDKIWYLWDGEKQTGPFSTVAMKKSIALRKLKPDRLVFREGFEDWKKLGETELWVRRPVPSLQSSLNSIGNASASNAPNAQVNEVFLWLLACSPGIGLLVSAVLKLCSSCSEDLCGGLGCLSFWFLNCVFARNDELLVKEVGGKSPNAIWGAIPILVPVYLLMRGITARSKYWTLPVWCVLVWVALGGLEKLDQSLHAHDRVVEEALREIQENREEDLRRIGVFSSSSEGKSDQTRRYSRKDEFDKELEEMNKRNKQLFETIAGQLAPSLKVEVLHNGMPVNGAEVHISGETKTTPIGAIKLRKGETVGPIDAVYEVGGNRYVARGRAMKVNWVGEKALQLVLYTEPNPVATKTVQLPGGAKLELVYCPPGEFLMGSPNTEMGREEDETQHRVTLTKGFWIGRYEVTQGQWKSVMGDNPSEESHLASVKGDDRPVMEVSWEDCQHFLKKAGLGLRLPTEAEWEYACRAGTTGRYAGTGRLDDMGWYGVNYHFELHPVGMKAPNAWSIYDMHGNVMEWCQDWKSSYDGEKRDPQGPATGYSRVCRGGNRHSRTHDCRSASREDHSPGWRSDNIGFRVACDDL